jgi:hypothetical protein
LGDRLIERLIDQGVNDALDINMTAETSPVAGWFITLIAREIPV